MTEPPLVWMVCPLVAVAPGLLFTVAAPGLLLTADEWSAACAGEDLGCFGSGVRSQASAEAAAIAVQTRAPTYAQVFASSGTAIAAARKVMIPAAATLERGPLTL